MTFLFAWMLLSCLAGMQGIVAESLGLPAITKLRLYQQRVDIILNRMKAEGCSIPPPPHVIHKRKLPADRINEQVKVESELYEKLTDLLITCRKGKMATEASRTTSAQQVVPITVTTTDVSTQATGTRTTTESSTATTVAEATNTTSAQQVVPNTATTTDVSTQATGTRTTTESATTTTVVARSCPKDYILNPVSSTCLRVVPQGMNWTTAKSTCESAGDFLAVFETLESVQWLFGFINDKKTPAAWKSSMMWIGLLNTGGVWRWVGRVTSAFPVDDDSWRQALGNLVDYPYGYVDTFMNAFQSSHRNYANGYPICEKRES